jgi:hypothetical protein
MPETRWIIDDALAVRASGGRMPFSSDARIAVLALISQLGTQIRVARV